MKINGFLKPSDVMKRRAAALMLALSLTLTGCGKSESGNYVPTNITPEEAITALKNDDEKFYLYDILTNTDMTFVNEYDENYEPKTFFQLSQQFIDARIILADCPNDENALKAANDALYGMNKLVMLAETCNSLGIEPSDVISFSYKHGSMPEGYIKYKFRWSEEIVGGVVIEREEECFQTVNLQGEFAKAAQNGDEACNGLFYVGGNGGFYNLDLDNGYAAVIRLITSECVYKEKTFGYSDPVICSSYDEVLALEVADDVLEQRSESAKTKSRK